MCYALLRAFGFSQAEAISRIREVRPEVVFCVIQNYLDSVERDLTSLWHDGIAGECQNFTVQFEGTQKLNDSRKS
jgi:hypothetical protein